MKKSLKLILASAFILPMVVGCVSDPTSSSCQVCSSQTCPTCSSCLLNEQELRAFYEMMKQDGFTGTFEEFINIIKENANNHEQSSETTSQAQSSEIEVVDENALFGISYNMSDPNMSGAYAPNFTEVAAQMGYEFTLKDSRNDYELGLNMLKQAAKEDYKAYFINPLDQSQGLAYINAVKDTNKPAIFWNREISQGAMDTYDKAYYVGTDHTEAGRLQGKMAAEYINEHGFDTLDRNHDGKLGVVVVRGERGHYDAESRTLYSPMYLERYLTGGNAQAKGKVNGRTYSYEGTTWNKVEVKEIIDAMDVQGYTWDPVTAANEVSRVLASDVRKGIDLVLSNNDGMVFGIIVSTEFKEAGIPIWGVDVLDDSILEINQDGTQFKGSCCLDVREEVKVALKVAENLINGTIPQRDLTIAYNKVDWERNDKAVWFDEETKTFRVHYKTFVKGDQR